ncbi:hypothetical protein Gotur_014940 [Gossypium turneri]
MVEVLSMEKELAKLSFEEEEDEGLQFATEARPQRSIYEMCLVGCYLTTSIFDFGEKRYLFRFFYEVDVEGVMSGMP